MIYLDHGATSFPKPPAVRRAMDRAMARCANPGRGGHQPAMEAAQTVFRCREQAAALFGCQPEQVAFTGSCTQGLNTAIRSLVRPGDRVLISGFEHNAVVRPLHALGARTTVAGQKLFDWADTLSRFQDGLKTRPAAAVFTHVSNVFGYVLPVAELGDLCRQYGVPFILDAAQSAGSLPVDLGTLGAAYIAMPGHKGLLGPMGTGLLLCGDMPMPLLFGGTGSDSMNRAMPDFLPDRLEAGTLNVPGIAGLAAGMALVRKEGPENIGRRETRQAMACARALEKLGLRVFSGPYQVGTVSFLPDGDCEDLAHRLGEQGVAVRAGLHCAPLAHENAGTLDTGTVRLSFGYDCESAKTGEFLRILEKVLEKATISSAFPSGKM